MAVRSESAWFQQARSEGELVVSDPPKFDLDSYIANYKGKTRAARLLHIGQTSTYLSNEALRLAVSETKAGKDVDLYLRIVKVFHEIFPEDPASQTDTNWVERTQRETAAESQHLEAQLRGYKNNLIKESIRMAYDDMGRHYQQTGQLGEAIKNFNKERDFCQLPAHIAIMANRLINAHIEQNGWISVEANVQKLRTLPQKQGEPDKLEARHSAALGLAEFSTQQYRKAALTFLDCSPRAIRGGGSDDPGTEELHSEVVSPNDIASYGALCALATMDREELQKRVLENSGFRNYLELEPHLRRAISSFVAGKYSQCLEILKTYRTDYILDLYLSSHYDRLFSMIRNKAIVQYFLPFSKVTFSALATAFKTTENDIVETLTELVKSKALAATLDLENSLLVANTTETRADMFKAAMEASQDYERVLQSRLLRFAASNANLEVIAPKQQAIGNGPGSRDLLMGRDYTAKGKGKAAREGRGIFS